MSFVVIDLTKRYSGGRPSRQESAVDWIVVHHNAVAPPKTDAQARKQLDAIHRQHNNEGWGGIGYHYAIAPDGTIYKCRRITESTVHARGANSRSIGIMLMGYFHVDAHYKGQPPTDEQIASLRELVRTIRKAMPSIVKVLPHREVPGSRTACPGDLFPYGAFRQLN